MKQLVIHFGDPFQYPGWPVGEPTESGELWFSNVEIQKKVLNLHFKIKGLQLENQIIQVIYVVQYQYTGLSVGEPTDPVEPWFSTVEIQKIRFKIYISISWFACWRTTDPVEPWFSTVGIQKIRF